MNPQTLLGPARHAARTRTTTTTTTITTIMPFRSFLRHCLPGSGRHHHQQHQKQQGQKSLQQRASLPALRAMFSSSSSSATTTADNTPTLLSPTRSPASSASSVPSSVTAAVKKSAAPAAAQRIRRYSVESPAGNRIWTFDEINEKLSSSSGNKSSPSSPQQKLLIVDVREPHELAQQGRIPGAENVPVTSRPDGYALPADEFEDAFGFLPPTRDAHEKTAITAKGKGGAEEEEAGQQQVIFYCRSGVRAHTAAMLAREAGWRGVGEYTGSFLDWTARGGKIERR
ncbi:Rhodanese-like domain-containing protein [Xylariaceae sp. FL0804]|nr:Rhodanese-like domain-containing protein [Xylariaceae sp. FL0804]